MGVNSDNIVSSGFFMEHLTFLSNQEAISIESWANDFKPLLESHPELRSTDLIIEGGVGTNRTLTHIARYLFPNALYIGMDLSEMNEGYKGRQQSEITENSLDRILKANNQPSLDMTGAILYASCFDYSLVNDIAQKTQRKHLILTTWNALNALIDKSLNPWERKYESDQTTFSQMTSPDSPYKTQLHLVNFDGLWDDTVSDATQRNYLGLEDSAIQSGWQSERLESGLLLRR